MTVYTGTIQHWYRRYRMGFVRAKDLKHDVWIHYSTAPKGVKYRAGMEIQFVLVATPRGYQAADVVVISDKGKVTRESRADRMRRHEIEEAGFEPVSWGRADGSVTSSTEWHLVDPLFPDMTMCGLSIPRDRVVEGGPYPKNCRICQGRAKRRQRESGT